MDYITRRGLSDFFVPHIHIHVFKELHLIIKSVMVVKEQKWAEDNL